MRKIYVFAITILMLSLFAWVSYYIYLEYRPVKYHNGTFVEVPKEMFDEEQEFSA